MASNPVEILSLEFVKPSSRSQDRLSEIKFSLFDQVVGPLVSRMVFFFENEPSSCTESRRKSQLLKQSLSLTLTKFYPFAGRINGSHSIVCEDSGVLFLEAKVDATLSEALQEEMIPDEIGAFFPPHPLGTDLVRNCVPLAIQFTYFRCGGMAIGVCITHRISDGSPSVMLMRSWASTCRGETLPVEDARIDIGAELFPPLDPGVLANIFDSITKNEERKMVRKRFVLDKEKIASLKRLASSQVRNPSSFEVVSAFVWKHMVESLRFRNSNKTTFVATVPVDVRKRMNPPVSDLALGNFVVPKLVSLKREMEIDYGVLVGGFRNAIRRSENEGMDYYLKCLFEYVQALGKPEVWACTLSSWRGYLSYGLDFGWGRPILVCPKISTPVVYLLTTRDGGGIEAWVHLAEDDMSSLSTDLLSLATMPLLNDEVNV